MRCYYFLLEFRLRLTATGQLQLYCFNHFLVLSHFCLLGLLLHLQLKHQVGSLLFYLLDLSFRLKFFFLHHFLNCLKLGFELTLDLPDFFFTELVSHLLVGPFQLSYPAFVEVDIIGVGFLQLFKLHFQEGDFLFVDSFFFLVLRYLDSQFFLQLHVQLRCLKFAGGKLGLKLLVLTFLPCQLPLQVLNLFFIFGDFVEVELFGFGRFFGRCLRQVSVGFLQLINKLVHLLDFFFHLLAFVILCLILSFVVSNFSLHFAQYFLVFVLCLAFELHHFTNCWGFFFFVLSNLFSILLLFKFIQSINFL